MNVNLKYYISGSYSTKYSKIRMRGEYNWSVTLVLETFFFVTGMDDYFVILGIFLFLTENHYKLAELKCTPDQVFYF